MRVKHKMWVNTARDSSMKDLVYGPSEDSRLVQTDGYEEWGGGSFVVPAAGAVDLDLSEVATIRGLYLQAAGEVEVTIDGADTAISLYRPQDVTNAVAKMFLEATVSSVTITNLGSEAVTGHFHIYGDSA